MLPNAPTEVTNSLYNLRDELTAETRNLDGVFQSLTQYTYNPNGQLTAETGPEGTKTYTYDPQQRLKTLHAVEPAGDTTDVTYTYDAHGLRTGQSTSHTENGTATTDSSIYLLDHLSPYGYPQVLEELTPGGLEGFPTSTGCTPSQTRNGTQSATSSTATAA